MLDGETVLTGSFNFTKAAQEKNAENGLLIRDPALAAQYTQNWQAHAQHSHPVRRTRGTLRLGHGDRHAAHRACHREEEI